MNTSKRSKQRDEILRVLKATKSHPSADWIYSEVRKTIPNISLGTVYRNLARLTADGAIQKLDVGQGCERYDGNSALHYHVVCTDCGCVTDIDAEPPFTLNEWAAEKFGGDIFSHSAVFVGRCIKCKNF